MKSIFGLAIFNIKKLEARTREERRTAFELGRVLGYAEAMNTRLTFILQPPDVNDQAEEILREAK